MTSARAKEIATVVCPEGRELGIAVVTWRSGRSTSHLTSWVVAFAPRTTTRARPARVRLRRISAKKAMSTPTRTIIGSETNEVTSSDTPPKRSDQWIADSMKSVSMP